MDCGRSFVGPSEAANSASRTRSVLQWLRLSKPSDSGSFAAHDHGEDVHSYAELLADRLFDEKEGHLSLLSGGHFLSQWFQGLSGPQELRVSHIAQLIAYLLLPHQPHTTPQQPSTTGPQNGATATAGGCDCEGPAHPHSATATPESPLCPRIRSWASRLMELVHGGNLPHLAHSSHPAASQPASPATAAAPAASSPTAPSAAPAFIPTTAAATEAASSARLLAASSDPLVASYRPLSFYLLTEAVAAATHLALRLLGFRMAGVTPGGAATVYEWTPRRATSAAAAAANANTEAEPDSSPEPPLVFLHGIGLGLTPYLRLLGRLVAASRGQRAVYAVQYKHVSMRLTANIPAPHEVAADVAVFLAARGVRSVSLLAHSYGTLVASALTKLAAASPAAPAIARLTLVDPVCFAMFLPHLVRNAIYQQPVVPAPSAAAELEAEAASDIAASTQRSGLLRSLIKGRLPGLVVAEFHCSVALRRRLDWARVNLWPSELPPDCTVVLSGRDNLVPVREVAAILANRAAMLGPAAHHPTVLLREDLGHGGFLGDAACQRQVLAAALGCSAEEVQRELDAAEAARRHQRSHAGVDQEDGVALSPASVRVPFAVIAGSVLRQPVHLPAAPRAKAASFVAARRGTPPAAPRLAPAANPWMFAAPQLLQSSAAALFGGRAAPAGGGASAPSAACTATATVLALALTYACGRGLGGAAGAASDVFENFDYGSASGSPREQTVEVLTALGVAAAVRKEAGGEKGEEVHGRLRQLLPVVWEPSPLVAFGGISDGLEPPRRAASPRAPSVRTRLHGSGKAGLAASPAPALLTARSAAVRRGASTTASSFGRQRLLR
ncbi:hypothetical protein GPECTOR_63g50 [Gonium pectorale]|uniref:AB hydrolase-1 domain-containing protein n=1 Tax=Gonium pectorale TaxID=33097 RepID=A0A150G5B5_GONPE|nr:hypothetical protein GPECTOR_63g50 [Gonium pectorale]|eukprot:KXZ44725.1 hypothetical protein GPECTOR_63g50 [Gonium pectorale]